MNEIPKPMTWRDTITQAELKELEGTRDFWKREARRYRDLYEVAQEEIEKLRKYVDGRGEA